MLLLRRYLENDFFNQYFSMYFHNIYENTNLLRCLLKKIESLKIKGNICQSNGMQKIISFHKYKSEKVFLARSNRGFENNVYSERPRIIQNCSAWPRLKLNTKIGLHTTTTTHPPPHKLLGSNISAVTGPI